MGTNAIRLDSLSTAGIAENAGRYIDLSTGRAGPSRSSSAAVETSRFTTSSWRTAASAAAGMPIVGAGTMGRLFGALLASADHDVVMIDTAPEAVESIERYGVALRWAGENVSVPAGPRGAKGSRLGAAYAADLVDPVDIVMVVTKTMHSVVALASVAHLIAPYTIGVSLQNGLGNDQPLIDAFGVDRTVLGVTTYPADLGAEGQVFSDLSGRVTVGGLVPAARARSADLAAMLAKAGMRAESCAHVMIPIWEKAIFNAGLNTVSAVSGMTIGEIGADDVALRLVDSVLAESFSVARAQGVRIDEARVRSAVESACRNHGDYKTSMLVDIEAGRPTEIASIGGAICSVGARQGVPTPVLGTLGDTVALRTAQAAGS